MKYFFITSIFLVVCDQIAKFFVAKHDLFVNLDVLDINFVQNTGAIWGSFQDFNIGFIFLSIIALLAIIKWHGTLPKKGASLMIIISGGIISNLIDRIFRGFVVDYIDFRFWPVFNIADSMIVVGVLSIIYIVYRDEYQKDAKKSIRKKK